MNATDIFEALAKRIFEQVSKRGKHSPSVSILRQLIETMFFASLETEESEPIRCRIAFMSKQNPDPKPPERIVADRWQCVSFQSEIPFDVSNRTKLAKAADPWASTLAVYASGEALKIWGAVDQSIHYSSHVVRENDEGPEMPGMFQAVIEGIGEVAIYRRFFLLVSLTEHVVL